MWPVIGKGIGIGSLGGFLLFELATGVLLFYALGSGHSINIAGSFVVNVRPNGAFALNVGSGYMIGAIVMMAAFSILVTVLLAASQRSGSRRQS
jgi:hypothetical protein